MAMCAMYTFLPITTPASPEDSPSVSSRTPEMQEMPWRVWMAQSWMDVTLQLFMPKRIEKNLSKCVVKTPLPAEMTAAETDFEMETDTVAMTEEEGGETETETETTTVVGITMHREITVEEEDVAVAVAVIEDIAEEARTETETAAVLTPETETEEEEEITGEVLRPAALVPPRRRGISLARCPAAAVAAPVNLGETLGWLHSCPHD